LLDRLAGHCLEGEHNISEQERRVERGARFRLPGWKREHVGWCIMPTETVIQPPLLGVVGKGDAKFNRHSRDVPRFCHADRQSDAGGAANQVFDIRTSELPTNAARGDNDRSWGPHYGSSARIDRSRAS